MLLAGPALATEDGYQMPPKSIADIVDAPMTPSTFLSPDRGWMIVAERPGLPTIEEISQPELRLAGVRINPRTNGPSRGWTYNGLQTLKVESGKLTEVTGLPENPRITDIDWSPDSKYAAFLNTANDRVQLWVLDAENAAARQLLDVPVNGAYGSEFAWFSDSRTLIVKTIPANRGERPGEVTVPSGPNIQENVGRVAPARTYQDLLASPHDEKLFEYYVTAQLMRVSLEGEATPIGKAGIIRSMEPSPDGQMILVETIHRPFSYTVPAYRFPQLVEVWDRDGNAVYQVADLPLAEEVPIAFGSVPTGPRSFGWRADADATLYWAEAQDAGDAAKEAEARDKVYLLEAPFNSKPTELITLASVRFGGVTWGSDDLAWVSGWWWPNRNEQAWWVKPGEPDAEPKKLIDRSWEDRYNDPGSPVTTSSKYGTRVLLTSDDGNAIYMDGGGSSPEGDRPFLDKFYLETGETERLFRSEAPYYEDPITFIDANEGLIVTRRESVTEPPNYYVRTLDDGSLRQLTEFPHPTPQLKDVSKELVKYERADGVQLTGTLYLPPGYDPESDGPLPMVMWAYPQEFKSADAAGQVTDSPYRFIRIGWWSPLMFLAHGYAVFDDPSMPIIGEEDEEPNDTFIEQLVSSAQAAVDEVVNRGVAERDKIAIAGHSYGAFMTANLLSHSDLFRAGIARSGAYNRTLTPFGFQSEERSLWEAPDVYFTMSPFMHADKMNEPLLLIHGEADNNSGTYPLQSERYYAALKGHGATVRLVMLPAESHGYRARESVMHTWYEMTQWLDTYVKEAGPRADVDMPAEEG
jgi:dipeptidyl aminopeptidase/acylaminoacyl peptidase